MLGDRDVDVGGDVVAAPAARPRSRRAGRSRRRAGRGGARGAGRRSAGSGRRPRRRASAGIGAGAVALVDRAAGVQREAAPAVGVRRRGRGRHDRRLAASSSGARRRKSAAAKLMFAPDSRSARSNGPKKPDSRCTPLCENSLVPTASSAPATRRSSQSSRSPSSRRNPGGWPLPSGRPSVSVGTRSRAAACSAVQLLGMAIADPCHRRGHDHWIYRPR